MDFETLGDHHTSDSVDGPTVTKHRTTFCSGSVELLFSPSKESDLFVASCFSYSMSFGDYFNKAALVGLVRGALSEAGLVTTSGTVAPFTSLAMVGLRTMARNVQFAHKAKRYGLRWQEEK